MCMTLALANKGTIEPKLLIKFEIIAIDVCNNDVANNMPREPIY